MKRRSGVHAPRPRRNFTLGVFLKMGISPMPMWISMLLAILVTVSAFDDVRLFILTRPEGMLSKFAVAGAVMYWAVWMALAFRPKLAPYFFVLLLVAMYPQARPGGILMLTFSALAVASYRISTRVLAGIVGVFLVWQFTWVLGVSRMGSESLWGYVPATLLLVAPGLAVKVLRERALQVERLQKEAEETAARAALEQRTALARELHDVVTHGLTMIAVQAHLGTISQDGDDRHHALTEIGSMARNSLDDLRRLLQTMRTEDLPAGAVSDTNVEQSSATIDLAQSLADAQQRLSGLGFPTRVETSGLVESIPKGLRSTLLRILQESSTNVAKHSGPGTECHISMQIKNSRVELTIRNRMTSGKPRLPVSGTGLAGLLERTSRLGGTLEASPLDGWWVVRATLPFTGRRSLG
ncbi:histidine kinase [Arthrobacter sp. LAPM80]|uniref:sensor histidine kinase n=1 Tax=Arthrobacter sp. LAPM80 TaxID=3141788 RepID=UPI00398B0E46